MNAELCYSIHATSGLLLPVGFLNLAQRHEDVRYAITAGLRYGLWRAPLEDFERMKQSIAVFFQSFKVLPAKKKSP
jgi:hypothetical protein